MTPLEKELQKGKLVGSRCLSCGYVHFPPLAFCPRCRKEMVLEEVPKVGEVLTWSQVYVSNGEFKTPYLVAIAKFGDYKIPGYVVGDRIEIGDRVEWAVGKVGKNLRLWYYFRTI